MHDHEYILKQYPYLKKPFKLFIKHDDSINAFAVGRNTICINRGLLALDDDAIKGFNTIFDEFYTTVEELGLYMAGAKREEVRQ